MGAEGSARDRSRTEHGQQQKKERKGPLGGGPNPDRPKAVIRLHGTDHRVAVPRAQKLDVVSKLPLIVEPPTTTWPDTDGVESWLPICVLGAKFAATGAENIMAELLDWCNTGKQKNRNFDLEGGAVRLGLKFYASTVSEVACTNLQQFVDQYGETIADPQHFVKSILALRTTEQNGHTEFYWQWEAVRQHPSYSPKLSRPCANDPGHEERPLLVMVIIQPKDAAATAWCEEKKKQPSKKQLRREVSRGQRGEGGGSGATGSRVGGSEEGGAGVTRDRSRARSEQGFVDDVSQSSEERARARRRPPPSRRGARSVSREQYMGLALQQCTCVWSVPTCPCVCLPTRPYLHSSLPCDLCLTLSTHVYFDSCAGPEQGSRPEAGRMAVCFLHHASPCTRGEGGEKRVTFCAGEAEGFSRTDFEIIMDCTRTAFGCS